jgi:pimeloyl-ACP methyl ester carboxylesterase
MLNHQSLASITLSALLLTAGGARPAHAAGEAADHRAGPGKYAPVNGLQMYYEIHGTARASGPPLVLLHGGGSTIGTSFGKVLRRLAAHRQIVAFEQQGHGHTADVDRPFTFEQSADDAAALLQFLKIERADLLGFSNGGSIALQIAIRHPALVRRQIIASAMFKRDGLPPQFWEAMKGAKVENMPLELREAYLRVAPHPEQLQSFHDKCAARMLQFKDWPASDMRAIVARTLVMVGDADVIRPEHAVEMFRVLPHAELAILPATTHMTMTDWNDQQVAMIERFLDAPAQPQPAQATAAPGR